MSPQMLAYWAGYPHKMTLIIVGEILLIRLVNAEQQLSHRPSGAIHCLRLFECIRFFVSLVKWFYFHLSYLHSGREMEQNNIGT